MGARTTLRVGPRLFDIKACILLEVFARFVFRLLYEIGIALSASDGDILFHDGVECLQNR
jgi:hypothetical protein